ncbi:hypothetical protein L6164_030172 [Bauhinia variegata]|nr:hypothetical protein L6164_030172 [Bauhinia variegata]
MMRSVVEIEWEDMRQAIPAFVTLILMPLTYSIAYGLIGGIGTYVVLNLWDWGAEFLAKFGVVKSKLSVPVPVPVRSVNGVNGTRTQPGHGQDANVKTLEVEF